MSDLSANSRLTFGKYKGLFIGDVIGFAPETIFWYVRNVPWFSLDAETKGKLSAAVKLERHNSMARQNAWAMGSFCGNGAWAKADAEKNQRQKSHLEVEARHRAGQSLDANLNWISQ